MRTPADRMLYRTAALVFEEMGFLLPSPSELAIGGEPAAGAVVAFKGPVQGALILRITRDVLPTLSANMLGEDEPADEAMERDALGEIANVICGNVLPPLTGCDAGFHLDKPMFFDGPAPSGSAMSELIAGVLIGLEAGKAEVLVYSA